MGVVVASRRFQGGRQALSEGDPFVISVVPDVSGIDKIFDYSVPPELRDAVSLGCRVRVPLNGRRVSGWVVSLEGVLHDRSRVVDIVSVSGLGVEESVVPLTKWISETFWGPWRSVLASASAPRMRGRAASGRHGAVTRPADDDISVATDEIFLRGGGLLVVPPLASALTVVGTAASYGPVLVVCPTVRMATLGAASLRRRGFSTAVLPDQWEMARAGVDVVLGARSAALGPCKDLRSIVVIDEHEETLREERSPTWNARLVAIERAHRAGVPIILTSPTPSAEASERFSGTTKMIPATPGWPKVVIENLNDLPIARSLLGSRLLAAVRDTNTTVGCVLNTKGVARLLSCTGCGTVQSCTRCGSALSDMGDGSLTCVRCRVVVGTVCVRCGRTGFKNLTRGTAQIVRELGASCSRTIIEVSSDADDSWVTGSVFVGTEAILARIPRADTLVFCDIDRDLMSARLSAAREVLALVAKAARLVGRDGEIVVQTRTPEHPIIAAFGSADIQRALAHWLDSDLGMRRDLGLPPFAVVARVSGCGPHAERLSAVPGVQVGLIDGDLLVRAPDRSTLSSFVATARQICGDLRVYSDPTRY